MGIFEGDEDTVKTVQELYGYVFYRKAPVPIEKMFIFYGEGRNGKSVMLDLLEMLVGSQNVASVMMSDLRDQNMRIQLYQKWVNVVAETPTKRAIEADLVKKIVSGDLISARRIYQPVMDFRPFAKHFISANILPQIDEQTEAMRRRIMVIPFNHDFRDDQSRQPKPELQEAFQREMPGILNWALEGLRRLKERNWILYTSPAIEDATREYLESSNSVKRFLKERCVYTGKEKDRWTYSEFYSAYLTFCEDRKLEAMGHKKLRKELERQGVIVNEGTGRALTVYRWRAKTAVELIGSWKSEYNE
jgi:putative DNA primase/helicase